MRHAILKAADQIEQTPEMFNFMSTVKPDLSCGTPGCALGWIGFFANLKPQEYGGFVSETATALGVNASQFYDRMDDCAEDREWIDSAQLCAKGLRAYADKYFPANS